MCLWFPGSLKEDMVCLIKTFTAVFPYASAWSGPKMKQGFYLIGTLKNVPQNVFQESVANAFNNEKIVTDLREYDSTL